LREIFLNNHISDFDKHFRGVIKKCFKDNNITGIHPDKLSGEITKQYSGKNQHLLSAGECNSTKITFSLSKENTDDECWTKINSYICIYIEEKCESNWLYSNKRILNYKLTIDLSGYSLNKNKIIKLSQMINQDGVEKNNQCIKSTMHVNMGSHLIVKFFHQPSPLCIRFSFYFVLCLNTNKF
jgi:hypothetical protein